MQTILLMPARIHVNPKRATIHAIHVSRALQLVAHAAESIGSVLELQQELSSQLVWRLQLVVTHHIPIIN